MLRDMKERHVNIGDFTPMICHEIQQAIVDVLITKTIKAAKEYDARSIILGGGVALNKELRHQIKRLSKDKLSSTALYLPPAKTHHRQRRNDRCSWIPPCYQKDFTKAESLKAQENLRL